MSVEKAFIASVVTDSALNNYLHFNKGGYIEIEHKSQYNARTFTLEAWIQWDDAGTNDSQFIIGKNFELFEIHTGYNSGTNGIRFIPIPNDQKSEWGGYPGDSWIDAKAEDGQTVMTNDWVHATAVF